MPMNMKTLLGACGIAVLALTPLEGQAKDWWPFEVQNVADGKSEAIDYVPLEQASKKWNICVLFPHMKDSFWVAAAYGIIEEAKRLGVKVTILEAGGYDQLPKQISQWDDCVASGAEAVVTGVISEAGMAPKFAEGLERGIPQVSFINAVIDAPLTARVRSEFDALGKASGDYLVKSLEPGAKEKVVAFPGPQGSGWADGYAKGFREALVGTNAELLEEKYGDTGVSIQLALVEDALQTYPDMSVIWGTAPTVEAAIRAVAEAGLKGDIKIMASYENQEMLDATMRGDVLGFASQYAVVQARMGIDLAVRALEGKDLLADTRVVPVVVTAKTASEFNMSDILAPADWRPVFTVD